MKKAKVYCDECGRNFVPKPKVKPVRSDIEKVCFYCPQCHTEYIAYYTNELIRTRQEKAAALLNRLSITRSSNEEYPQLRKQYELLKNELGILIDSLKNQMEE